MGPKGRGCPHGLPLSEHAARSRRRRLRLRREARRPKAGLALALGRAGGDVGAARRRRATGGAGGVDRGAGGGAAERRAPRGAARRRRGERGGDLRRRGRDVGCLRAVGAVPLVGLQPRRGGGPLAPLRRARCLAGLGDFAAASAGCTRARTGARRGRSGCCGRGARSGRPTSPWGPTGRTWRVGRPTSTRRGLARAWGPWYRRGTGAGRGRRSRVRGAGGAVRVVVLGRAGRSALRGDGRGRVADERPLPVAREPEPPRPLA